MPCDREEAATRGFAGGDGSTCCWNLPSDLHWFHRAASASPILADASDKSKSVQAVNRLRIPYAVGNRAKNEEESASTNEVQFDAKPSMVQLSL